MERGEHPSPRAQMELNTGQGAEIKTGWCCRAGPELPILQSGRVQQHIPDTGPMPPGQLQNHKVPEGLQASGKGLSVMARAQETQRESTN